MALPKCTESSLKTRVWKGIESTTSRRMIEIERITKSNLALIQEIVVECCILDDAIQQKLVEYDVGCAEVVGNTKEMRKLVADKPYQDGQLEVQNIRDENKYVAGQFGKACEHMFRVGKKVSQVKVVHE